MVSKHPRRIEFDRQLALERPAYCEECFARRICGDAYTAQACPEQSDGRTGRPANPNTLGRMLYLGGLDLTDIVVKYPTPKISLPPYVTTIEPRGVGKGLSLKFAAVTLKDGYSASGSARKATTLRRRTGVPDETTLLLLCTGTDELVASAIDRGSQALVDATANGGFNIVSGIGTSFYRASNPMERLLSIKEGLLSFALMQSRGIPSFPMLAFSTMADIERLAEWLHLNPLVRLVGVDMQDNRWSTDKRFFAEAFRELVRLSPSDLHWIVKGPSSRNWIRRLFMICPRLTVINEQPFMKATKGGGSRPRKSRKALFNEYWHEQFSLCAGAKRAALPH